MKKVVILVSLLVLFIILNSSQTYAEYLGVGLFCDKYVYEKDGLVAYDYEKALEDTDLKYKKGDIVSCYLAIYYDGDQKYNQVSFTAEDTNEFKFSSLEKSSVWNEEIDDGNRFILKSDNQLSGGRVVGILKYTMLVDGDDLEIPIKDFYINDYAIIDGEFFGKVNDTNAEHRYIPPEEKKEEPKEPFEYEEADTVIESKDDDSRVYTYILISFVMLIFLFVLYVIKNYIKDRRIFD